MQHFTAANYCSMLRQLPQLREAYLNTGCPLSSWEPELPHMPHLTSLTLFEPWYWRVDEQPVEEAALRRVLARLPSVRRLAFREATPADVGQRLQVDFCTGTGFTF